MDMDLQKIELIELYTKQTRELKKLTDVIETSAIGASPSVERFIDLTIERNRLAETIKMTIGDNTFDAFEFFGLYDYRKQSFERDTDYLLHTLKLKKQHIFCRLRNEALKCCVKNNFIDSEDFVDEYPSNDKLNDNLEQLKTLTEFKKRYFNTEYKKMIFFSRFVDINDIDKCKNYTYNMFNEELQQYLYCIMNLRFINSDEKVFSEIYDTVKNYIIKNMIDYFEELEDFIKAYRNRFRKTNRKTHNNFLNLLKYDYYNLKYTLSVIEEREA
ncbi:TPA: hypothetical protein NGW16_004229 [Vibrio parahaemolyticus]|nr:hypothetical protein [Vibrio cholerae]HCE4999493.1 hypothetical protein [Vibrio parahaemolyticus]